MNELKHILIKKYWLETLKYDFMGYRFNSLDELTYHHLLIPSRNSHEDGYGDGRYLWNGVLLRRVTSHDYLHVIEMYDLDRFLAITSEMLEEKIKGYLSLSNLKRIDDILTSFEKEYVNEKIHSRYIIKSEYLERLFSKNQSLR